jgi:glycosyltransferase involved in cell wall biosynthesis
VIRNKRILALVGGLVGYIYRRSDLVLGQSHSLVSEISSYLSHPERVDYLPGWSEQTLAAGAEVRPAPEVPDRPDLFTIVFTGNIGEAQDFPAVLAAAAHLRGYPVRWVIVGDGRKSEWVREEVSRLGLRETVLLPGRFPLDRMPEFYARGDALLVSLKADPIFAMTIPGKVQAYLTAGKPILAMLDGEGAEVVRTAGAGRTVPSGDSAALAAAVLELMAASPSARAAMAQRGRTYAAREFGRAAIVSRLESCLERVVRERRRALQ